MRDLREIGGQAPAALLERDEFARQSCGAGEAKKPRGNGAFERKPGDFLLSHTVACAVPSGLRSLTTVFGMGTGGSSSLRSPRTGDAGGSRPVQRWNI